MKRNKNVRKVATVGLGLIAVAALVMAPVPGAHAKGPPAPTEPVGVDCANASGANDFDDDNFPDTLECSGTGFTLPDGVTVFEPCSNFATPGTVFCLDPNRATAIVIVVSSDDLGTGTGHFEPIGNEALLEFMSRTVGNGGLNVDVIPIEHTQMCAGLGAGEFCNNRTLTGGQLLLRIFESLSTSTKFLGKCDAGLVKDDCTILTQNIVNNVNANYSKAGDTDTAKQAADIRRYIQWATNHEGGHGYRVKKCEDILLCHYSTKAKLVGSTTVVVKVSTQKNKVTYTIGDQYADADEVDRVVH